MKPCWKLFETAPDPEAAAKVALDYEEYRAWRAYALGRPYKRTWKAHAVKPIPGVMDLADDEAG